MLMRAAVAAAAVALAGSARAQSNAATLKEQVRQAESAFARSMAERNHAAFAAYVAEDAVFFGGQTVQRGKAAVVAAWKPLFDKPQAPFSWEPAEVEVLDSGTLALSSGPVYDSSGKRSGTFSSVWRREKDGSWKVVFDKGCDCPAAAAGPSPAP